MVVVASPSKSFQWERALPSNTDARAKQLGQSYIYLGGSVVAVREKTLAGGVVSVKYQHTDALGTPVAVTDASRNVVKRSEYGPYERLQSSIQLLPVSRD